MYVPHRKGNTSSKVMMHGRSDLMTDDGPLLYYKLRLWVSGYDN